MNRFLRPSRIWSGLLYIGFVILLNSANAQGGHVYNQFFMNPYIYNPAYAGVDGHAVIFAMYKQQWSNISSGPKLAHASYHVPLKGGIGFGVGAFNESLGPIQTNAGKVTGSYLVNIDRKHFLRLGMSLGMGSNMKTLDEQAIADPAFNGESSSYLIGDFGATYHFDHFNVGFSMPNLFSSNIISESGFTSFKVKPTDNMLFKMNYRGHIGHEFAIEPHILYRYSSVLPSQFEVATVVHVKHVAWVGATYRQDAGVVGLLGVKLKKKFAVGAAFELGNSDINSLTGSSFEIHIGMHMGDHHKGGSHKKAHVDHHKSWFLTHDEEKVAEAAARKRRDSLLAIQQNQVNDPVIATDPDPTETEVTEWDSDNEIVAFVDESGNVQSGQKMERTLPDGSKEVIATFAPPRDGGKAWGIAPGAHQYEERTNLDGTKEVGVKYVRIGADGSLESKIVWAPVTDDAGAAALLAGGNSSGQDTTETDPGNNTEEPNDSTNPVDTTPVDTTPVDTTPIDTTPVDTTPQETQPTDQQLGNSDEHHEVTRGGSPVEFPPGIYVVGGSFKSLQQAESFSQRMFHRGYKAGNKVGRINGRDNWYVVLKDFKTLAEARRERERIKGSVRGAWVLKVN